MEVAGKQVSAACALVEELAGQDGLEAYDLNPATKEQVSKVWDTVYGGWNA